MGRSVGCTHVKTWVQIHSTNISWAWLHEAVEKQVDRVSWWPVTLVKMVSFKFGERLSQGIKVGDNGERHPTSSSDSMHINRPINNTLDTVAKLEELKTRFRDVLTSCVV